MFIHYLPYEIIMRITIRETCKLVEVVTANFSTKKKIKNTFEFFLNFFGGLITKHKSSAFIHRNRKTRPKRDI